MNRKTRLPFKRAKPRRNEGRVTHRRMKKKESAPPDAAEAIHHDRIRAMGCLVCGNPPTIHHVTASIHGGRIARSHKRVVGLCPKHHHVQWGPKESVEALGHRGFHLTYGIDLLAEADRLWNETVALLKEVPYIGPAGPAHPPVG